MWKNRQVGELLEEARAIQQRLPTERREMNADEVTRIFTKLMFEGSVSSALNFLNRKDHGGIQALTPEVRAKLEALHPEPDEGPADVYLPGDPPEVQPVIYEEITAGSIKQAANRTRGGAGPSGGDAEHWKRMLYSFGDKSEELAGAMASAARRMCTDYMDPDSLMAFLANRLIPLDKNPGTRPIGIGEVPRRIIGKAVVAVLKKDIKRAAGVTQLCAGQEGGAEAAIHAMLEIFELDDTDAVLLVDAQNAFNTLNRRAALHNIRIICPPFATILINWYRTPARLFVAGGMELASQEGTTQGCPLAMQMYALGVVPLIDRLRPFLSDSGEGEVGMRYDEEEEEGGEEGDNEVEGEGDKEGGEGRQTSRRGAVQTWYADDSQAAGHLRVLRAWWDAIARIGPGYGYHCNPSKTYLVVKPHLMVEASELFEGTGVKVVDGACRDLGAFIGDLPRAHKFVEEKIDKWVRMVEKLAEVARVQPHAAYTSFVAGLSHSWTYTQRTMGGISHLFANLRDVIQQKLIPALFDEKEGHAFGDQFLSLLALPHRHGGMRFTDPVEECADKRSDSREITSLLTNLIKASERSLPEDYEDQVYAVKADLRKTRSRREEARAEGVHAGLPNELRRAAEAAAEKGGSAVFTVLPLERHGFAIRSKRDWFDHLRMRYRMHIRGLPSTCACGQPYTLDHSQICKTGGFIHMRHDEPKDLFARCCSELFRDVAVEPLLENLTGEVMRSGSAKVEEECRSDVRVRGFWRKGQDAFFEFRVFYPFASSYLSSSLPALYRRHSKARKREYEERINRVDCGSFTPMVAASTGGMCAEMQIALKFLASLLAEKRKEKYCDVMRLLRCRFAFAMARSALVCLRGSRSRYQGLQADSFELPARVVSNEASL
jgi:hypothetical protein